MTRSLILLPTAIAAALAMAACSPRDDTTAARNNDATVVQRTDPAAANTKEAARDAGTTVANAATDAMITTKVNAALAADDKLKAIKIDVDTSAGRVVMTGSAPDADSRERATTLARSVEGVVGVDNRLTVDGKS